LFAAAVQLVRLHPAAAASDKRLKEEKFATDWLLNIIKDTRFMYMRESRIYLVPADMKCKVLLWARTEQQLKQQSLSSTAAAAAPGTCDTSKINSFRNKHSEGQGTCQAPAAKASQSHLAKGRKRQAASGSHRQGMKTAGHPSKMARP
jgi:hypothetical protein